MLIFLLLKCAGFVSSIRKVWRASGRKLSGREYTGSGYRDFFRFYLSRFAMRAGETQKKFVSEIKFSCLKPSFWQVMYSKLFLLFGIFWVTEAVHAVLDNWWLESLHEEECNTFTEVFFRFASGCNLLRGLFIFLAFCCKTTIWQSFRKADRLPKIKVQGLSCPGWSRRLTYLSTTDWQNYSDLQTKPPEFGPKGKPEVAGRCERRNENERSEDFSPSASPSTKGWKLE